MSGKKWLALVLCAVLLVVLVCGALNVVVDPFNAFGDRFLPWDAYSQTLAPRSSKAVYLSEHFDEFDSYVIGSSSAASYLPETLEGYFGGSFYNAFHYGADTHYDLQLVRWLLTHDDVKHIVLILGLSEATVPNDAPVSFENEPYFEVSGKSALRYWLHFLFASPSFALEKLTSMPQDTEMPQPFDVFLPQDGTYDKRLRDVESIGALEPYLALHGGDFYNFAPGATLDAWEDCVSNVSQIRALCTQYGAQLTVILTPATAQQLNGYDDRTLALYFSSLLDAGAYWNFAITPLTYDPRFFYDVNHTRNAASDLVLAKIAGDPKADNFPSFGVYCREGSAFTADDVSALKASAQAADPAQMSATVPILLYHHLDETAQESATTLRPETFRRQMQLLKDSGCHTVSFQDLMDFVDYGAPLPENPVIITFDDGYTSNYTYAFPILRVYGFQATIFPIGVSVGHSEFYKDTQYPLTPHFGQSEIDEMVSSGLISLGSHTYDMHQWAPYETGSPVRENLLPLEGESQEDYLAAVARDARRQAELFTSLGLEPPTVLAFPQGEHTPLTDVALRACGCRVTLTTDAQRTNTVLYGLPQSLVDLGRMTVSQLTTDQDILTYVLGG